MPDAIDAAIGVAIDAGPRIRDGGAATIDAGPKVAGTAKLKIGADPWGEIYIDGTARGRTPAVLEVPAGKHVVEIVYRGEDPPKKKSYSVDLSADETRPLQADFTD